MTVAPQQSTDAAAPAAPAVVLEGVCRTYARPAGDVNALSGVSLTVPAGRTVAITGASGSGKSTLLFLIGGLDRPTAGRISVFGTCYNDLTEDGLADVRRHRIGFVFQDYHLIPSLTVCENVMLPLIPIAGNSLALRARALHCIERVGLDKRIGHLPGELSGGEQQRVAIARALVGDPSLILGDEPTGNLDSGTAGTIRDLLLNLAQAESKTVILVTHSREVAERCHERVRLHEGMRVEG